LLRADRKRGYNETLAYGAFTGGDVDLVAMTLQAIDALQTRMLKHPDNRFNSSALGRYQIVRTTLRAIRKTVKLPRRPCSTPRCRIAAPATSSACAASTNIWRGGSRKIR